MQCYSANWEIRYAHLNLRVQGFGIKERAQTLVKETVNYSYIYYLWFSREMASVICMSNKAAYYKRSVTQLERLALCWQYSGKR